MPKLATVDVSVSDHLITLTFSHSSLAAAYFAYLQSEDSKPENLQPIPGYRRHPKFLGPRTKQVTLTLPSFITWFITCRLPDDEDSVTFTYGDSHDEYASLWAENMILFEKVPLPGSSSPYSSGDGWEAGIGAGGGERNRGRGRVTEQDEEVVKQLHVRRLWNRAKLVERLGALTTGGGPWRRASAGTSTGGTNSHSSSRVQSRERSNSNNMHTAHHHHHHHYQQQQHQQAVVMGGNNNRWNQHPGIAPLPAAVTTAVGMTAMTTMSNDPDVWW